MAVNKIQKKQEVVLLLSMLALSIYQNWFFDKLQMAY
jgi:hypothetical protein